MSSTVPRLRGAFNRVHKSSRSRASSHQTGVQARLLQGDSIARTQGETISSTILLPSMGLRPLQKGNSLPEAP